jgi:AraC family transcriptional regulator of adaptative response/methylated-DNA-[protein]-cysteine methyltransferase
MATMLAEPMISPNEAWRAVTDRDAGYDGQFVYAVKSTRIYCRPSCPSRRPSRENVRFYAAPDEAERGGYRACKRCDPRDERRDDPIAKARAYLDAAGERAVSLPELAAHAGVSASHLQRSFKRAVGVSPKEYQHARRVAQFKSRLRAGDTVSRATYEAGFGSSSRVYENADAMLGMTPAAFRRGGAGVRIQYAIADAAVGRVLIATTDRGVCAVAMGESDAALTRDLAADFPNATIERSDRAHADWVRAVLARIRDPRRARGDVPLDIAGTAFQRKVWKALQEIPPGELRSYRDVAASIGRPTATRAVARACATNPVAVVIPCHRVVRQDGARSGYRWGADRKQRLLDGEQG